MESDFIKVTDIHKPLSGMHEKLFESISAKVSLTAAEFEILKPLLIPKKYRKRQYLLNAGDKCQYLTFVEKGLLRSFSVDAKGGEHVMQFALEGWWIADVASFLCGDDAIYNIEALEDAEVLLLTKNSMDEIMNRVPKIERYFRLLMENNVIALQRRIRVVQTHSAEDSYLKLMEVSPEILRRASQQHIASYMGISPETLSRIRKQVSKR